MQKTTFKFFRNNDKLLELYNELLLQLSDLPKLVVKKRKSYAKMVVFCNRRNFAYISLLENGEDFLDEGFKIVFSINSKISNVRIQTITEPHSGCFSHHTIIKEKCDIDEELTEWLKQSYVNAQ